MKSKLSLPTTSTCYYVIAQAARGKTLFRADGEYALYGALIKKYKQRYGVRLYAFCLLPDRVYFVLQPFIKKDIHHFLQGIACQYADVVKTRAPFLEPRWQKRPKITAISTDKDFFACIHYVEQAPVLWRLAQSAIMYPYSSCAYRILGFTNPLIDTLLPLEVREKILC